MSRNYGSVRTRRGNAVWQWVVIGVVLGFGCAAVMLLAGLTFGFIGIDPSGQGAVGARMTQTPWLITPTVDPNATQAVMVVTATPDLEATVAAAQTQAADSQVIAPTPTLAPTDTPAGASTESTTDAAASTPATTTGGDATGTTDTTGTNTQAAGDTTAQGAAGGIPPQLAALASALVPVDAGTFRMGTTFAEITEAVRICTTQLNGQCSTVDGEDSTPDRDVTLDGFAMERTEVTYEQYVAFLNYLLTQGRDHTNGCGTTIPQRCVDTRSIEDPNSNITFDSANYDVALSSQLALPVVNVTWHGADAYCRTIGRRLPTEAEWERTARGPSGNLYPWGNDWNPDNAKTSRSTDTSQGPLGVELYPGGISGFGALNMSGNVAEWVADWYSPTYYQPNNTGNNVNPTGPISGVDRVVRGGAWSDHPFFARTVHRQHFPPANDYPTVGFRCAADLESTLPQTDTNLGTTGSTFATPESGQVDPLNLGTIGGSTPESGGAAPQLPTAPVAASPTPGTVATLAP